MPDYVVLISTLGGMSVFGLTGFVLGPAIAALFMATWDLFSHMQKDEEAQLLLEHEQMLAQTQAEAEAEAEAATLPALEHPATAPVDADKTPKT